MNPIILTLSLLSAPGPVLVLAPIPLSPASPAELSRIQLSLSNALRRAEVPVRRGPRPHGTAPTPAIGRAVDQAVAAAQDKGDLAQARAILEDVLAREESPIGERAHRLLQLARIQLRTKDPAYEATLAHAVFLDPSLSAGRGATPRFRKALKRARDKVLSRPRGALKISGPAGARLSLDGRFMGVLPTELTEVFAGEHQLRARLRGATWARSVTVRPKLRTAVRMEPVRPEDWLRVGSVRRGQLPLWRRRARGAGATRVLVSALYGPKGARKLALTLVSLEPKKVGRLGSFSPADRAAMDRMSAVIAAGGAGAEVRARPFALAEGWALPKPRVRRVRVAPSR